MSIFHRVVIVPLSNNTFSLLSSGTTWVTALRKEPPRVDSDLNSLFECSTRIVRSHLPRDALVPTLQPTPISLNARDWFRRDNRNVVTVPLHSLNVAAAPTASQSSGSVYGTTVQIVRSSAMCVWSHWLTLRRCLASRIPGERCASTVLCNKTKSRCRAGSSLSAFVNSMISIMCTEISMSTYPGGCVFRSRAGWLFQAQRSRPESRVASIDVSTGDGRRRIKMTKESAVRGGSWSEAGETRHSSYFGGTSHRHVLRDSDHTNLPLQ